MTLSKIIGALIAFISIYIVNSLSGNSSFFRDIFGVLFFYGIYVYTIIDSTIDIGNSMLISRFSDRASAILYIIVRSRTRTIIYISIFFIVTILYNYWKLEKFESIILLLSYYLINLMNLFLLYSMYVVIRFFYIKPIALAVVLSIIFISFILALESQITFNFLFAVMNNNITWGTILSIVLSYLVLIGFYYLKRRKDILI